MKKTILIYSAFILSIFIIVPQVYADHPKIRYAKKVSYTYTPTGGSETTVDALDINGKYLYQTRSGVIIKPVVKLGNVSLTVLHTGVIADTSRHQVVVQLPVPFVEGSYELLVDNIGETGIIGITLGAVGPQGPDGVAGADGTDGIRGLRGLTGAAGTDGTIGPRGLTGTNGADSTVAGPRGAAGVTGATGTSGSTGARGFTGAAGVDGADGANGATGAAGAAGARGERGVDGATGASGAQGNTSTKAWVNFNGTGTPVIRAHTGIFRVIRVSTGVYTIQFSTAFADTNYVMTATANTGIVFIGTPDRAEMTIKVLDTSGNPIDSSRIMLEFTSN